MINFKIFISIIVVILILLGVVLVLSPKGTTVDAINQGKREASSPVAQTGSSTENSESNVSYASVKSSSSPLTLPNSVVTSLSSVLPSSPLPVGWKSGFVSYQYAGGIQPLYEGKPVVAYVQASDKKLLLQPNQSGTFPRLFLDYSAKTDVILQFPQGQEGDIVGVSAVDGGFLGKGDATQILTLNSDRAVKFSFTLSENQGVSRVSIQSGSQTNYLDFWAGPDNVYPQVAISSTK